MRPYIAFYKGKTIEIQASSSYSAQVAAAKLLKVSEKNRYRVTVKLLDIVHSTSDL
jgi:hypothetical protein